MTGDIRRIFELQKARAPEVGAAPLIERKRKLHRLHDAVLRRRAEIHKALADDLGKSLEETDLSEIYVALAESRHAIRHLRGWARRRVPTPLPLFGSRSEVRYEPKGVVLIVAPWNFPFNLTMGPLVSAIAAGNCAIVKPSEFAPATARCVGSIVGELFDESEVAVVEGGVDVAQTLFTMPFDHIFFTGSTKVGRLVMRAAAENLTPVTLELGGKSPAIVDETANLDEAAKKIAWGKFINNGQTCIAPDYVLVQSTVEKEFTRKLLGQVDRIWGDSSHVRTSRDYGRIVDERHHARVRQQVEAAVAGGAEVLTGGEHDASERFFSPTVIRGVAAGSALATEEIFGPVLPIRPFDSLQDAIAEVNSLECPLVLYLFSGSRENTETVLGATRAGDTLVNDTLIHYFQHYLPFGGVGASGMGKGHGEAGFQTFSNARGVMRQRTRWSAMQFLYPPYSNLKRRLIELTIRYL
jgi:aldehyde dehydrogenase (NAD+)